MSWFKRTPRETGGAAVIAPAPRDPIALTPRAPVLPPYHFADTTVRIAVIGDTHGRIDLMERLVPALDEAARDTARTLVEVYLGDYVDRGANPKAMLEFLSRRRDLTDRRVVCLAGNHEQMLLAALDGDRQFGTWLDFGGQSTLMSYGISPKLAKADPATVRQALREAIPAHHLDFLSSLHLHYETGGFFFVHAGVRPGIALAEQTSKDLLWIRDPFLTTPANLGAIIVHGHTPTAGVAFRRNRIGVDTGAYRTGNLTCLFITSDGMQIKDTTGAR